MRTETYVLPVWWASYLINGDESGYDEGEIDLIDQWQLRAFPFGEMALAVSVACEDEEGYEGFRRCHDATCVMPLAADCSTYTFRIYPNP